MTCYSLTVSLATCLPDSGLLLYWSDVDGRLEIDLEVLDDEVWCWEDIVRMAGCPLFFWAWLGPMGLDGCGG